MLLFGSLLSIYVFCRAVLPLRLHWGWKAGLGAALLATAFKFHLLHLFGGPMFFAPELPEPLLIAAAWLFAALFLFFFLLIAADLGRGLCLLCLLCAKRRPTERFRRVGNRVNLALLAAAAALAGCGIVSGTSVPEVRHEEIALPGLPGELDGMTVAVLADLHIDSLARIGRVRAIVDRVAPLNPDLILLAGDFVDGRVAVRGGDLRPLEELSAPLGVFGVPGNHEYYSGYEEWMLFLSGLGIDMLENSHRILAGGKLALGGVTDPAAARFGRETPDLRKTFDGAPPGAVKLLLAHQPKPAAEAAKSGVALQVSGHTHGGMIVGIDRLVARFNAGFVAGSYRVGDLRLYVSRGSGIWNGFPIRLGLPSEITLLRLKRQE